MDQEDKLLDLFRQTAASVAEQFKADIDTYEALNGKKFPIEEMMPKLQELDKALIEKAIKVIDSYKKATGGNADSLTEKCRVVISSTVEDFVKLI
jgi:hypothetical protein